MENIRHTSHIFIQKITLLLENSFIYSPLNFKIFKMYMLTISVSWEVTHMYLT